MPCGTAFLGVRPPGALLDAGELATHASGALLLFGALANGSTLTLHKSSKLPVARTSDTDIPNRQARRDLPEGGGRVKAVTHPRSIRS